MTIHIDAFTAYTLIAIIGIICMISIISFIVLLKRNKEITRQLEDTNRLLYFNLKAYQTNQSQTSECLDELDVMREDIHELSSGLQIKLQHDEAKSNEKHFPLPDEVKMIEETIKDQMSIEMIKRSKQNAPSGGALVEVTANVIRTYPHINEDYIVNKCVAVMQEYVS